jgi:hypothetical protein
MQPSLFQLQDLESRTSLYVSQISTCDALKMFDPADPLAITKFGAILTDREFNPWLSLDALPILATVEDGVRFLEKNDDAMTLIDFFATIDGHNSLSTHDDGEAEFIFPDRTRAVDILHALTGTDPMTALAKTVLQNPGKYVLFENGEARIFATFDDYCKRFRLQTSP